MSACACVIVCTMHQGFVQEFSTEERNVECRPTPPYVSPEISDSLTRLLMTSGAKELIIVIVIFREKIPAWGGYGKHDTKLITSKRQRVCIMPLLSPPLHSPCCLSGVPLIAGSFQTFESEANLLRRIAGHKCMIAAPAIQILNFTDEALQRFYSGLPHHKQPLLRELFLQPACTEAYMYSLYGVTMATKIKVCANLVVFAKKNTTVLCFGSYRWTPRSRRHT